MSSEETSRRQSRVWAILPAQRLLFGGWDDDSVVVYAEGSGDTHQVDAAAALILRALVGQSRSEADLLTILQAESALMSPEAPADVLDEMLGELARIGLIRRHKARDGGA